MQDDGDATKEELVRKLGSRTKHELADQLGSHLTKDELQRVLDQRSKRDDDDERPRDDTDTDTDIDWSAELDWAPPPRPTPAPVTFVGAAPFMPGQRVRVDLAGLPMLGIFAGTLADEQVRSLSATFVALHERIDELTEELASARTVA